MLASFLKICHVNVNSLLCNFSIFCSFFSSNFFHVIALSETWLSGTINDSVVNLPDYILLRHDRVGRRGGGVAVYVHTSLRAKLLSASQSEYCNMPEFMFVEVQCGNASPLLIAVVYRRPRAGYLQVFESSLVHFYPAYRNLIITGDFNADLLGSSFDAEYHSNFFFAYNLQIVPYSATHHTATSHTWLDLFVVDDVSKVLSSYQSSVPFAGGHELIAINYNFKTAPFIPRSFSFRNFINFDSNAFLEEL